jgi:hypothetical protein
MSAELKTVLRNHLASLKEQEGEAKSIPGHGADIARGFMITRISLEEDLKAIGMDIPKTVNGETLGGLVIDVAAINDGDMLSRSS